MLNLAATWFARATAAFILLSLLVIAHHNGVVRVSTINVLGHRVVCLGWWP